MILIHQFQSIKILIKKVRYERYLTETDPNKNLRDLTKSESMNLDTPEIAALVEILKPEDQNSRVVRQQCRKFYEKIFY